MRWRLLAAIGAIAVVGLASGLTLPLVSVRLAEAGASASLIALMATLPAVGTIAIASVLTPLTRCLGPKLLLVAALLLSCISLLVLLKTYSAGLWALSRLTMGASAGVLYALGEARILEISSDRTRGRWIGLYAATLTGCQLAGPALLAVLGVHAAAPLWMAAGLHTLALVLVAVGEWQTQSSSERSGALSLRSFLTIALPLAVAVVYFSMFDSSMLSLLPLYGLAVGFSERTAVMLASAVLLGDACLQLLVGWAADRYGRTRIHLVCGVLTCTAALIAAVLASSQSALWLALFAMGGAAGGLYTLAIVQVGDRFTSAALISANAYIGLMWGLGSISGPVAGSGAMAVCGPKGLLLFVALGALVFLLVACLRPLRRPTDLQTAGSGDQGARGLPS